MTSTAVSVLGLAMALIFADIASAMSVASVSCKGVKLVKLGCYDDDQKKPRPLPELVLTDRDRTSAVYSGVRVNWKNWDNYMAGLICRCAQKSLAKNYNVIGLQHYGECWSGDNSKTSNYARSGPTSHCITWRGKPCAGGLDCIGEDNSNFIYRVVRDKPQPTASPTGRPKTPSSTAPTTNFTPSPTQTTPNTPKPTPPTTPKPTQPTTPKPTPPTTPNPTTSAPKTTKPSQSPTKGSGTSTARPPTQPTEAPNPCTPASPQIGCQQPVQPCPYPPCTQAVVPHWQVIKDDVVVGCGKSGVPCPGKGKSHKVPSLDDSTEDDDDDDDDDDDGDNYDDK